jgi:hypothetical protein
LKGDPNFEFYRFDRAEDLLRAIEPAPALDTESPCPEFIFRGQADASWRLVPKAIRRENASGKTKALTIIDSYMLNDTAVDQVFGEIQLLRMFIEACDRASIALPGDGYEFRRLWMDDQDGALGRAYLDPSVWPFDAHLPLLAFAQHHGIPTRLLDWSQRALVAAYFAAAEAVVVGGSEPLAVWALNIEMVHLYPQIRVVRMPGANSARLGAQRGLLELPPSNRTT